MTRWLLDVGVWAMDKNEWNHVSTLYMKMFVATGLIHLALKPLCFDDSLLVKKNICELQLNRIYFCILRLRRFSMACF